METTAPLSSANDEPQGVLGESTDKAKELADQAVEKLDEARTSVQTQLKDQLDRRSTEAGDQTLSVATALQHSAEDLRSEGNTTPARVLEEVSEQVERVGGYLSSADSERMLRDLEDFVYRRPLLVVGIAAAAGFAAARFLGASSRRRSGEASVARRPELSVVPASATRALTQPPVPAPSPTLDHTMERGGQARGYSSV